MAIALITMNAIFIVGKKVAPTTNSVASALEIPDKAMT